MGEAKVVEFDATDVVSCALDRRRILAHAGVDSGHFSRHVCSFRVMSRTDFTSKAFSLFELRAGCDFADVFDPEGVNPNLIGSLGPPTFGRVRKLLKTSAVGVHGTRQIPVLVFGIAQAFAAAAR